MRRLIAVGLVIGAFLIVGAVPVMAQSLPGPSDGQGGIADPLTLAASGVLVPFFTGGSMGTVATLQVASPVSDNPDAHMFFFDATCARIPISVGMPLTTNDIAFQQIGSAQGGPVTTGTNGLVTLAKADSTGFSLIPLDPGHPVHARMYEFSGVDGRSRVLEPIILNTEEFNGSKLFPQQQNWWSPLRSGATFFSPLQTTTVQTDLALICPRTTIQGSKGAAFGPFNVTYDSRTGGTDYDATIAGVAFPAINPRFPLTSDPGTLRVRVYDTNEVFLRDFTINCACISVFAAIANSIHPIYADPVAAANGTYTELTSPPTGAATANANARTTFSGYTSSFTVGSAINAFFARIHNGSQSSIDGTTTDDR